MLQIGRERRNVKGIHRMSIFSVHVQHQKYSLCNQTLKPINSNEPTNLDLRVNTRNEVLPSCGNSQRTCTSVIWLLYRHCRKCISLRIPKNYTNISQMILI